MAGFSDYLEGNVMAWVNGTTMPSAPSTRYISLHNGDPLDTGLGGTEVTTTIRTAGRLAGTFTRSTGVLVLAADVDFGAASGSATVSHFGIWDAASGGNLLMVGTLTGGAQSISTGTGVKFNSGSMTLSLD